MPNIDAEAAGINIEGGYDPRTRPRIARNQNQRRVVLGGWGHWTVIICGCWSVIKARALRRSRLELNTPYSVGVVILSHELHCERRVVGNVQQIEI
jgi:hypothetical protein